MTKIPKALSVIRFDAQHRLLLALAATAVVFFIALGRVSVPALIMVSWVTCALVIIILNWTVILSVHPREVRQLARLKDSSRFIILLFVIVASCVSLFSIIFLLQSSKAANGSHSSELNKHILLSIGSVIVSWWMLHTVFTMNYAHMYYTETPDPDDEPTNVTGGLDFPDDEKNPDYLDFAYFAFVIGMTFQVSDVEISSRRIRRLVLLHGLISFAFNTAIVALSINVVSGLV